MCRNTDLLKDTLSNFDTNHMMHWVKMYKLARYKLHNYFPMNIGASELPHGNMVRPYSSSISCNEILNSMYHLIFFFTCIYRFRHMPCEYLIVLIEHSKIWHFVIKRRSDLDENKENLRDLIASTGLTEIWFKSLIFQPVWPWNLVHDLEKL